eukprot:TRINITY_DN67909_c2_g1_i1.p1 TRINITY_DN67909_c2_g1~~TRINITY_DN67909_c2_g1_i1.p1  ORF type:complete len:288 (-),score=-4.92 TRINITY_DN67909_c2_g1_i1:235-1098(-)
MLRGCVRKYVWQDSARQLVVRVSNVVSATLEGSQFLNVNQESTLVEKLPHDAKCFTQGLHYDLKSGLLFESCGKYGQSGLRAVELHTGRTVQEHSLPVYVFAEGVTIWNDHIYQLSWKEGKIYIYDVASLELLRTAHMPTHKGRRLEGWGLTHDGEHLILSSGEPALYFLNPETLAIEKVISVQYKNGSELHDINDLQYIGHDRVVANVWGAKFLVLIDLLTGDVLDKLDVSNLYPSLDYDPIVMDVNNCLNGVTWLPNTNQLLITGKHWPNLFVVEVPRAWLPSQS